MNAPGLHDRLARIAPVGSPDPQALHGAWVVLDARIAQLDPGDGVPVVLAGRRHRRPVRRVGTAVLVGAAAVLAGVVPVLSAGGPPPAASASAAEVLLSAGEAAGEQTGDARDAAYGHMSMVDSSPGSDVVEARRDEWMGREEWSVLIDTAESSEPFLSGHARFGPNPPGTSSSRCRRSRSRSRARCGPPATRTTRPR